MVSIRLPEEMETKLEKLAAATERSKSFYIKEALRLYLEEVEDTFDVIDRLSRPGRKTYRSDEVQRMLEDRPDTEEGM